MSHVAFALQKLLTLSSKSLGIYAIFNDQSFNYKLTDNIVSLEQLGPDHVSILILKFEQVCLTMCLKLSVE